MTFELLCMGLIAILLGLAIAFWGYRLFLVLLPLWGFFFGFALGAETVAVLTGDALLWTITGWIVGFLVGLVFALLSYFFYIAGVALLAGSFGYALGAGFMGLFGLESGFLPWIVGIVVGIIVAALVLLLNIQKPAVELITAAIGAAITVLGLLLPFGVVEAGANLAQTAQAAFQDSFFWAVLWLVLAGIAFVFQVRQNKLYVITEPERSF